MMMFVGEIQVVVGVEVYWFVYVGDDVCQCVDCFVVGLVGVSGGFVIVFDQVYQWCVDFVLQQCGVGCCVVLVGFVVIDYQYVYVCFGQCVGDQVVGDVCINYCYFVLCVGVQ